MLHVLKRLVRRALNMPGWEADKSHTPDAAQWRRFFSSLTNREQAIIALGTLFIVGGLSIVGIRSYYARTEVLPFVGGNVTVGVVGRPLYINPVLAESNAADRDLERLIFAGLFRYSPAGNLIPELAETYAIGEFGKIVDVTIRDGIFWPDGVPLTADDIAFTIESIQNPDIRSPLLSNWTGIGVEVLDELNVRFTLPAPYPPFLHNLTIGILPKHAWEDVTPRNFALAEQNLKPMGLGPYRPSRLERRRDGHVTSYTLEKNPASLREPLIDTVTLRFFDRQQDALVAFNRREIQFLGSINSNDVENLRQGVEVKSAALPRAFAIFFNQAQSKALADDDVRMALIHGVDRAPLLALLGGEPYVAGLESPLPDIMFGSTDEAERYGYNVDKALTVLEENEWLIPEPKEAKDEDANNEEEDVDNVDSTIESTPEEVVIPWIRENDDGDSLTFTLTHREDDTVLKIAKTLQTQWARLGVEVKLRSLTAGAFRKAIIERDYDAILAGQELPLDPDLFAFWHSSQKFDPGGNLALYDSPSVDAILNDARKAFDVDIRLQLYRDAQKLLMDDVPAIFLWSERYVSAIDPMVQGISFDLLANPSWRFGNVDEWFVRTRRVWTR